VLSIAVLFVNAINIDAALARFETQAQTTNVEIIRNSNESCLVSNCHDVTFELLVDGDPVQGRCTSGTFSPMVCRLYTGGD